MPDPDFWSWLRRNWGKAVAMVSPFLVAPVFKALGQLWPPLLADIQPYSRVIPFLLNTIALAILLWFLGKRPAVSEQRCPEASAKVLKFNAWWHAMWCIWFVQYVVLTALKWPLEGATGEDFSSRLAGAGDVPLAGSFALEALLSLMALGTCACLVMCYLVLANRRATGAELVGKIVPLFLLLWLPTVVEAGLAFNGDVTAHHYALYLLWGTTSYGALYCIAICVLVGRLESRIIAPPLLVIVLLYAYGALLLAATVFEGAQQLPGLNLDVRELAGQTWRGLLLFAVFLKALLFVFVYWLLHSGVLLFYMQWMVDAGDGKNDIDERRRKFVKELGLAQLPNPQPFPIPPLDAAPVTSVPRR